MYLGRSVSIFSLIRGEICVRTLEWRGMKGGKVVVPIPMNDLWHKDNVDFFMGIQEY